MKHESSAVFNEHHRCASSHQSLLGHRHRPWDVAEAQINMRKPARFKSVPAELQIELQTEGCRIPQSYKCGVPHNVIGGEFARKGQRDWAGLCDNGHGVSKIRLLWGGPATCDSEVAAAANRNYLQTTGENRSSTTAVVHFPAAHTYLVEGGEAGALIGTRSSLRARRE